VPALGEDETFVGAHSSAVWDLGKVAKVGFLFSGKVNLSSASCGLWSGMNGVSFEVCVGRA
jgi:hypothetical protein